MYLEAWREVELRSVFANLLNDLERPVFDNVKRGSEEDAVPFMRIGEWRRSWNMAI
jgi:hypothetical protein